MLIRLKPIFMERIWGGRKLAQFDYQLPPGQIGEAWCISAHQAGCSIVANGEFSGMTLRELYQTNRQFFANDPRAEFPLLIKILDAEQDLSIQIHPDDMYAKEHENSLGKTECWYVLDASEDGRLVLGHQGDTEEAKAAIKQEQWADVLRYQMVEKGDFFFVPAGTIHAICAGTLIYEVQQSSDITYRLYDYNRLEQGKPRELHQAKGLAVLKDFDYDKINTSQFITNQKQTYRQLVDCEFFRVACYEIQSELDRIEINNEPYSLCSVFGGTVVINGETFKHGAHFICPSTVEKMEVTGSGQLFVTQPK